MSRYDFAQKRMDTVHARRPILRAGSDALTSGMLILHAGWDALTSGMLILHAGWDAATAGVLILREFYFLPKSAGISPHCLVSHL